MLVSVYLMVEGDFIFDDDDDVKKDFKVPRDKSTLKFNKFITEMLNDVFSETFTHQKLMKHGWMRR